MNDRCDDKKIRDSHDALKAIRRSDVEVYIDESVVKQ